MVDLIFQLLWILLFLSILFPTMKQWSIRESRFKLIRQMEIKRKSRVITLIHRQESYSFFGLTFSRFIDIEDSEYVLRAIRMTPPDMPIDFIIHTPGGLVLAAEQIARALQDHKAKVTVFIPHYAMSGGTLIALSADEIVMDKNAVMGPVDPQIGGYAAASILGVLKKKDVNEIDDQTLILADLSEKAMNQVRKFVKKLLLKHMNEDKAEEVAEKLTSGIWTHDYPITFEEAEELGLNVSTDVPEEVYELMELYPQTSQRRPSVQYVPIPYKQSDESRKKKGDAV